MCLLLLQYRTVAAAPVLVAANREEFFGRKATVPCIQAGSPRVLCGSDQQAGGTWLGVNQHGLVVGVTNRLKSSLPDRPRSRGLLCRDLLDCTSAAEATAQALAELETGCYAGANYACFDAKTAAVVHGGDSLKVVELDPGVHILTNGDVDDRGDPRQFFARKFLAARFPNTIESFVDLAAVLCRQRPNDEGEPTIILRGTDRGTVSSTVLAVARRPEHARYLHSAGAPDLHPYEDYSSLFSEVLSAGRVQAAGNKSAADAGGAN